MPETTGAPIASHAAAMPVDRLGELPSDLGLLRVSEVEAVREADRLPADTGNVPCGLEDGERAARERVETRDAALAVEREREPAHRRSQPQHGGVEPRSPDRSGSHELVVAPEDELAAAKRRRTEQLEERLVRGWRVDDLDRGSRRASRLPDLVARALVREQPRGDLPDDLVSPERAQLAGVRHLADDRVLELPAIENGLDGLEHLRANDRDHPLLALGDHRPPTAPSPPRAAARGRGTRRSRGRPPSRTATRRCPPRHSPVATRRARTRRARLTTRSASSR